MRYLFLLLLSIPTMLLAQSKVAVYVTSTSSTVDDITKNIVGSELVSALVVNPDYQAVERTQDFLSQISQEQGYQRSGNVDDQQISALGKQFGVDFVCVANILPYKDMYYVQARMIDVESATVKVTAREISKLDDIDVIVSTAEKLANKLVGAKENVQDTLIIEQEKEVILQELSTIQSQSYDCAVLCSIDNTGSATNVVFKLVTASNMTANFSSTAYILDRETNIKYSLLGAVGVSTTKMQPFSPGISTFTVTFEKLPNTTKNIDIIESDSWKWNNIHLFPYGELNYHVFYDYSETKLEELYNKQKVNQQKQRELDENVDNITNSIAGIVTTLTSYTLIVTNHKHSDYYVYVADAFIGVVKGKSVASFQINLKQQGKIVFKQANGYVLYPTIKEWNAPKCKLNDILKYTID